VLLRWWAEQNAKGRTLCAGMDSTKVSRSWKPQEIVNQIRVARNQQGISGHIHWNMKSLMSNSAFDEVLVKDVYQHAALMPPSPWLGRAQPVKPKLTVAAGNAGSQLEIRWTPGSSGKASLWLVQTRTGGKWTEEILPAARATRVWRGAQPEVVAVSAVNRNGELSAPSVLQARSDAK
jgi:hypothetical protein